MCVGLSKYTITAGNPNILAFAVITSKEVVPRFERSDFTSCSSFLLCLTFQIVLVKYTKYNIISGVFSSILLSMRYNHLSGITIRHFAALDFFAKSYIDQGCVIHYHSVCIWLFIFCICTLFNNVMQL